MAKKNSDPNYSRPGTRAKGKSYSSAGMHNLCPVEKTYRDHAEEKTRKYRVVFGV